MRILLERLTSDDDSTVGAMFIDGQFICWTCEDEFRELKVPKETRIPAGAYIIQLRAEGGFHNRYKARYGEAWHKGMLHVTDVPGFKWILIHTGNTDDHTEGCILVGQSAILNDNGGGTIGGSRNAYRKFYPPVRDALLRGEAVTLTITDRDR